MSDMVILWVFVIGYVVLWRHVVGHILDDFSSHHRDPDGEEIFMACLAGTFMTFFWPILLPSRVVYILAQKYGPADKSAALILFPPPRKIETRAERDRRKEREEREKIQTHRRAVNDREKELGMKLTVWS